MPSHAYSADLQSMIDRAGRLTPEEATALGNLWKEQEALYWPAPSPATAVFGEVASPLVSNQQLVDAWERALDVAGRAGRVDEIEAAEDAGRAARRDERHQHDSAAARDGSEEAVRSATLAVGVRDLLTDDDYRTLTAAWQQVMGPEVL